jgi:hypothetical protein
MRRLAGSALKDYNDTIRVIKDEAGKYDIDTVVSVVNSGVGVQGNVVRDVTNSSISTLKPMNTYIANGSSTPLFDSIGDLIEQFESLPDKDDPSVSFLVMVITDGQENSSRKWTAGKIVSAIKRLQGTDRWTFTFRVPKGYKRDLVSQFNIPEDNIIEWDLSNQGMAAASVAHEAGIRNYYSSRSVGVSSSKAFYADLSGVSFNEVKKSLDDITNQVMQFQVTAYDPDSIRPFIQSKGYIYIKGSAYYELTKSETVQSHKDIIILDKQSRKYYSGDNARDLLGLPRYVEIKLRPAMSDRYKIYVQSTSVNRRLIPGTDLLMLR